MPEVKRRRRVETVKLRPPTKGDLAAEEVRRARKAAENERVSAAQRQRAKAIADNERLLRIQEERNRQQDERIAASPLNRDMRVINNTLAGVVGGLSGLGLRQAYGLVPGVRRGLRRGKRYADAGMRKAGRGAGKAVRYARSVPRKSASELRGEIGRAAGGAVSRVRSAAQSVDAAELLSNARTRASMAAVAAAGAGKSGVRRAVAAGAEPLEAVRSAIKDNKDRLRERGSEAMRKVNAGKAVKSIRGAVGSGVKGTIIGMGAGAGVGMARGAMNERTNGGSEEGIRPYLWDAAQVAASLGPMIPGAVGGVKRRVRAQRIKKAMARGSAKRASGGTTAAATSAPASAAPKATVLNSSLGSSSSGTGSPSGGGRSIKGLSGQKARGIRPSPLPNLPRPRPSSQTGSAMKDVAGSAKGRLDQERQAIRKRPDGTLYRRQPAAAARAASAGMASAIARGAAAGAARGSKLGLIGAVGGTLIGGAGGYRAYAEPKIRREMDQMRTGNAKADLQGRRVSGRQTTGAMGGRSALGEVRSTNPEIRKKVAGVREAIGYASSVGRKRLDTGGDTSLASIQTQMQKSAAYRKLSPADQAKANTALGQWHKTQRQLNKRPM
jgi:hypothetical protein